MARLRGNNTLLLNIATIEGMVEWYLNHELLHEDVRVKKVSWNGTNNQFTVETEEIVVPEAERG